MPLYTRISRDGQDMSLRWGWWHVSMMRAASDYLGGNIMETGSFTIPDGSYFAVADVSDREELWLLPGDRLEMFR